MVHSHFLSSKSLAALAGLLAVAGSANALTVTIDGLTSPTALSDAVDTCMSAGAGPHTINITADALPGADRQVVITQPITINGDADGDNIPCDILVDMNGIRSGADAGVQGYKSYIEIQATGIVAINDLNIHPNADGSFATAATSPATNVSGIRAFKPALAADTGTYNFKNVGVSGSTTDNAYQSLGTGTDLFSNGAKRWAGLGNDGAGEANHTKHAALHFAQDDAVGVGSILSTLDHCEMGLSRGCAVSITASNTTATILGGIFGHSARDGIRIADGASATIKGTATDRVRVVRSTNIRAGNAHSIEVVGGSTVPLIEYVDVAGEATANGLALRDGEVGEINYFRSLGKFQETDPNNHGIFIGSANIKVGLIRNSTIAADGSPIGDPVGIVAAVANPIDFVDTIFTSRWTTESLTVDSTTSGVAEFIHCALPTDGIVGESLANPPITGAGAAIEGVVIVEDAINVSPLYLLTLEDYDWSDAQGAGNPLNGAGNFNVLRPSNPLYLTAASNGGPLTGGAGPLNASIDANTWMLME